MFGMVEWGSFLACVLTWGSFLGVWGHLQGGRGTSPFIPRGPFVGDCMWDLLARVRGAASAVARQVIVTKTISVPQPGLKRDPNNPSHPENIATRCSITLLMNGRLETGLNFSNI